MGNGLCLFEAAQMEGLHSPLWCNLRAYATGRAVVRCRLQPAPAEKIAHTAAIPSPRVARSARTTHRRFVDEQRFRHLLVARIVLRGQEAVDQRAQQVAPHFARIVGAGDQRHQRRHHHHRGESDQGQVQVRDAEHPECIFNRAEIFE